MVGLKYYKKLTTFQRSKPSLLPLYNSIREENQPPSGLININMHPLHTFYIQLTSDHEIEIHTTRSKFYLPVGHRFCLPLGTSQRFAMDVVTEGKTGKKGNPLESCLPPPPELETDSILRRTPKREIGGVHR